MLLMSCFSAGIKLRARLIWKASVLLSTPLAFISVILMALTFKNFTLPRLCPFVCCDMSSVYSK